MATTITVQGKTFSVPDGDAWEMIEHIDPKSPPKVRAARIARRRAACENIIRENGLRWTTGLAGKIQAELCRNFVFPADRK